MKLRRVHVAHHSAIYYTSVCECLCNKEIGREEAGMKWTNAFIAYRIWTWVCGWNSPFELKCQYCNYEYWIIRYIQDTWNLNRTQGFSAHMKRALDGGLCCVLLFGQKQSCSRCKIAQHMSSCQSMRKYQTKQCFYVLWMLHWSKHKDLT